MNNYPPLRGPGILPRGTDEETAQRARNITLQKIQSEYPIDQEVILISRKQAKEIAFCPRILYCTTLDDGSIILISEGWCETLGMNQPIDVNFEITWIKNDGKKEHILVNHAINRLGRIREIRQLRSLPQKVRDEATRIAQEFANLQLKRLEFFQRIFSDVLIELTKKNPNKV